MLFQDSGIHFTLTPRSTVLEMLGHCPFSGILLYAWVLEGEGLGEAL